MILYIYLMMSEEKQIRNWAVLAPSFVHPTSRQNEKNMEEFIGELYSLFELRKKRSFILKAIIVDWIRKNDFTWAGDEFLSIHGNPKLVDGSFRFPYPMPVAVRLHAFFVVNVEDAGEVFAREDDDIYVTVTVSSKLIWNPRLILKNGIQLLRGDPIS